MGRKLPPGRPDPAPCNTPMLSPQRGQTLHPTHRTTRPGGSLGGHSHPPPLFPSPEPARKKASYGGQTAINRYPLSLGGGRCQGGTARIGRREAPERTTKIATGGGCLKKVPGSRTTPGPGAGRSSPATVSTQPPLPGVGLGRKLPPGRPDPAPCNTPMLSPQRGQTLPSPPTAPRVRAVPSAAIPAQTPLLSSPEPARKKAF